MNTYRFVSFYHVPFTHGRCVRCPSNQFEYRTDYRWKIWKAMSQSHPDGPLCTDKWSENVKNHFLHFPNQSIISITMY